MTNVSRVKYCNFDSTVFGRKKNLEIEFKTAMLIEAPPSIILIYNLKSWNKIISLF